MVSLPGEVPHGDCAGNDHLLTGEDELGGPDKTNQVVPPEDPHRGRVFVGHRHGVVVEATIAGSNVTFVNERILF